MAYISGYTGSRRPVQGLRTKPTLRHATVCESTPSPTAKSQNRFAPVFEHAVAMVAKAHARRACPPSDKGQVRPTVHTYWAPHLFRPVRRRCACRMGSTHTPYSQDVLFCCFAFAFMFSFPSACHEHGGSLIITAAGCTGIQCVLHSDALGRVAPTL